MLGGAFGFLESLGALLAGLRPGPGTASTVGVRSLGSLHASCLAVTGPTEHRKHRPPASCRPSALGHHFNLGEAASSRTPRCPRASGLWIAGLRPFPQDEILQNVSAPASEPAPQRNVALVSLVSLRSKAAWRPQSVRKALTGRRPPGSQSITSATFCRISFSGKYPTAGMYTMQRP